MLKALKFAAAVGIFATPALAADLDIVEPAPVPVLEPHHVWGYIDGRFGWRWADAGWDYSHLNAAARGAYRFAPNWSAQLDIWGNYRDADPRRGDLGGAAHLTYVAANGHQFGGMVSFGYDTDDHDMYGTIALEAAHESGAWRFYGQAGYTGGLSSEANDETWYAGGVAGYYFNSNFYAAGSLAVNYETFDWGARESELIWGAVLEHKLSSAPLSGYISYWGEYSDYSDGSFSDNGIQHNLMAGIRFFFHSDLTLREINRNVGLIDMNPEYGEFVFR